MRMTAYKACETSGDVNYMEAFARPAVKVPAIIRPGDKGPFDDVSPIENFERSTTSSP